MIHLLIPTAVLPALVVAGLWWVRSSERRPRHAGAGLGALTVTHLLAQLRDDPAPEPIIWPAADPDAEIPPPQPTGWASPTPEHLQRVLDGLRRL